MTRDVDEGVEIEQRRVSRRAVLSGGAARARRRMRSDRLGRGGKDRRGIETHEGRDTAVTPVEARRWVRGRGDHDVSGMSERRRVGGRRSIAIRCPCPQAEHRWIETRRSRRGEVAVAFTETTDVASDGEEATSCRHRVSFSARWRGPRTPGPGGAKAVLGARASASCRQIGRRACRREEPFTASHGG